MYENVKGHPAFLAFTASPTPAQEMQVTKEVEKDKADEQQENNAE